MPLSTSIRPNRFPLCPSYANRPPKVNREQTSFEEWLFSISNEIESNQHQLKFIRIRKGRQYPSRGSYDRSRYFDFRIGRESIFEPCKVQFWYRGRDKKRAVVPDERIYCVTVCFLSMMIIVMKNDGGSREMRVFNLSGMGGCDFSCFLCTGMDRVLEARVFLPKVFLWCLVMKLFMERCEITSKKNSILKTVEIIQI